MFELAGYRLDQDIRDIKDEMEDISFVLGLGSIVRVFPDERVLKASPVDFLDETWECWLAVTKNIIYKIARSQGYTGDIFEKVNRYFLELYGKPTESQSSKEVINHIWDFQTANLVVYSHRSSNVINIIATGGKEVSKVTKVYPRPKAYGCFTFIIVLIIVIAMLGYMFSIIR